MRWIERLSNISELQGVQNWMIAGDEMAPAKSAPDTAKGTVKPALMQNVTVGTSNTFLRFAFGFVPRERRGRGAEAGRLTIPTEEKSNDQ